jgi:hypothetical protein
MIVDIVSKSTAIFQENNVGREETEINGFEEVVDVQRMPFEGCIKFDGFEIEEKRGYRIYQSHKDVPFWDL